MKLIFGIEFEASSWSHAALLLNTADPSELKVVAYIDDAGVRHEGPPPAEAERAA